MGTKMPEDLENSKDPENSKDLDLNDAEFGHLTQVAALLTEFDFELTSPPAELWDNIVSGLAVADRTLVSIEPEPEPELELVKPELLEQAVLSDPRKQASQSQRGRNIFLAAAAAVLVLVVGAVGIRLADSSRVSTEQVASVNLDVLEGPATAEAKLLRTGDTERLVVTAKNMPAAPVGSHYELWLVDPKVTSPHSLGPMTGSTEVVIPASIDPKLYPVVDISLQKNGSHVHSGRSLLRGTLQ